MLLGRTHAAMLSTLNQDAKDDKRSLGHTVVDAGAHKPASRSPRTATGAPTTSSCPAGPLQRAMGGKHRRGRKKKRPRRNYRAVAREPASRRSASSGRRPSRSAPRGRRWDIRKTGPGWWSIVRSSVSYIKMLSCEGQHVWSEVLMPWAAYAGFPVTIWLTLIDSVLTFALLGGGLLRMVNQVG